MSEHTKNFVDLVANGSSAEAGDAFKDALRDKVASALDNKRVELAGTLFQAQSFSDPKPEIADPGTFNPDGTVTLKADGKADIDLTQPSIAGVDIANDEGK